MDFDGVLSPAETVISEIEHGKTVGDQKQKIAVMFYAERSFRRQCEEEENSQFSTQ
jgi:hypothetical protein